MQVDQLTVRGLADGSASGGAAVIDISGSCKEKISYVVVSTP